MKQRTRLVWKKSCDTCRRFKKQLDTWGLSYDEREMNAQPLSAEDVDQLIGDRPVKPFLNTRNIVYREKKLSQNTPSRGDAIKLIAETNNLLRRPVLIVDGEYVIGADLNRAQELLDLP